MNADEYEYTLTYWKGVRTNKAGLWTFMNLVGLIGKNPLTDLTGFEVHINEEIKDYWDTSGMSIHCEVDSEVIDNSMPEQ